MASRPSVENLPRIIPVFPLAGALLLPGGLLPLNIFEPRYVAMIDDALGWGRLVGMVQPIAGDARGADDGEPALYETGCVGRISQFAETEDERYLITLAGVCRFRIVEEAAPARGYRRVTVDWDPYKADLDEDVEPQIDRPRLMMVLKSYGKLHGLELNWKAVENASDRALTVSLPMACPFEPSEKQALLECADASVRAATLITLMEMAVAEGQTSRPTLIKQ